MEPQRPAPGLDRRWIDLAKPPRSGSVNLIDESRDEVGRSRQRVSLSDWIRYNLKVMPKKLQAVGELQGSCPLFRGKSAPAE